MEGFIGEIRYFAGKYEPNGWAFCTGQRLSIMQYQALFSVIGPSYGDPNDPNNRVTFQLPDMRPRKDNGAVREWEDWEPRAIICLEGSYPARS